MDAARREKNTEILEWFDALVFALVLVLVVLLFVVRTVSVDGISMVPTLQNGELLLARGLFYTPERGDIVVVDGYTGYGERLVKRVIALGGDEVDIDGETGEVYVNGGVLSEDYVSALSAGPGNVAFPLVVPEGKLFLMGDNRPNSKDSRHSDIGFIDERDILGVVFFRMLPSSRFGEV